MEYPLETYQEKALQKREENKKFLHKLKKKKPKNLDVLMEGINEDVFSKIDCLQCANCCKTTGPLFTEKDIERISSKLKMKEKEFVSQYLRIDEDHDYVLQKVPCSFLMADNHCMIYEFRPKACREFPHLDQKKFHQITHLTAKNCEICPAVYEGLEQLKGCNF